MRVSYDLALYLKYFKQKKWFTYSVLNRRIKQFKCSASDALRKPCAVSSNGVKLSGKAIQNWNFLRLLPVIMGDKVKEPMYDVWQLTLQLKDIVEMICAWRISLPEVAYLDVLIQEYLAYRLSLFPGQRLKPKHHYLRHYAALILKFGPLIRLCLLSKRIVHSYFKRCARNLKNFKNLCFTLNNTKISAEVMYRGTLYRKGQFLVTNNMDSVEFGELALVLRKDEVIHFLLRKFVAEFIPEYHLHELKNQTQVMQCVKINDLAYFYNFICDE